MQQLSRVHTSTGCVSASGYGTDVLKENENINSFRYLSLAAHNLNGFTMLSSFDPMACKRELASFLLPAISED